MATESVIAHRVLEVLVKELGLTQVVGLVASVASITADQIEPDKPDEAKGYRRDAQKIRLVMPQLSH